MDLGYRDAFADHAGIPSVLKTTLGMDIDRPFVTVAIPTYRRPQYLAKVLQSVIEQDFPHPVEIIVVDNDNDDDRLQAIVASLPHSPARPIRYFVNTENIGMFGNWNRCIQLARGEWITILNDDDLLLPTFLARSFAAMERQGPMDGIVCRKLHYVWSTGRIFQPYWRRTLRSLAFRWRYNRHNMMRVTPRKLFFGNELNNGCGFLFRQQVGIALGGYRQEEFPAADFWFYIRMCIDYGLYWLNEELALIGLGENETMRKSTIMTSIGLANDYYLAMTDGHVPRDWIKLRPQLTANQIHIYQKDLGVEFTPEEIQRIEEQVGPLPPPSHGRIRRFRLINGGY